MRRTSRTLAMLALAATALTGCGGSGDDEAGDDPVDTGSESTSSGEEGSDDETSDEQGSGEQGSGPDISVGDDMAAVTVGDTTYEFTLNQCQTFPGGLAGGGSAADGSDVELNFAFPPEQTGDPASISVRDEDTGERWDADAEAMEMITNIEAGQSEVTGYEVDGKQASASGSFVDRNAAMTGPTDAVDGSFQVSCP